MKIRFSFTFGMGGEAERELFHICFTKVDKPDNNVHSFLAILLLFVSLIFRLMACGTLDLERS